MNSNLESRFAFSRIFGDAHVCSRFFFRSIPGKCESGKLLREKDRETKRERERESDCVGARLFHSKSKFHSIDLSIYLYM